MTQMHMYIITNFFSTARKVDILATGRQCYCTHFIITKFLHLKKVTLREVFIISTILSFVFI